VRISPVFLGLVAIFIAAGGYLWTRPNVPYPAQPVRIGIFVFVAVGWVISLCLHEFDHAFLAFRAGDQSVVGRGYLTLDPRRYMNRQLSIVLPIIIVLLGGIGLPGGAVMIDQRLPRASRSLVSAAGPLTNALLAIACVLPIKLHWVGPTRSSFAEGLAFLALLQVAVTVLNSLPVPGLDGFGVISPYMPPATVRRLMPISTYVFLGLFVILLYSATAANGFYNFLYRVMGHVGVNPQLAQNGQLLFTFWWHL
jgi:Zn-dependent protease